MPIRIVRNDITKMEVDAIVNAAKPSLLGGGGVDGAIHRAAGPELLEECRRLGGCPTGEARITKGYKLPSRYVIHTVGPVWKDGAHAEAELLASCYRASLRLAEEYALKSIAFPLISAGIYGYPKPQAMRVAMDSISAFLMEHDRDEMTVYLVIYSRDSMLLGQKLSADIRQYIDDHYVETHPTHTYRREEESAVFNAPFIDQPDLSLRPSYSPKTGATPPPDMAAALSEGNPFGPLDESFQQMLLRKIDEKGITDAQCYKKANIDRKLFSKIRGDVHYQPSKKTALALAVSLELDLPQTRELLEKAGFALSRSNMFDVIVEYFIAHGQYNIFEINEALFAYDQVTLG